MIVIVDDEEVFRETVSRVLTGAGYAVREFEGPSSALEQLADLVPEIIISDIMMPDMTGYEFKQEYDGKFASRNTPFVFLSSLTDSDSMVKGLDMDADDYITKPIEPEVLKAKVRSILRRRHRNSLPVFHGNVSRMPFIDLIKFSETKGLTGRLDIMVDNRLLSLKFQGGVPQFEDLMDEDIEKLYDIEEGEFIVYSLPVDLGELSIVQGELESDKTSADDASNELVFTEKDKPMGILSGVTLGHRLFQLQTEFVMVPEYMVVTLTVFNGKVLAKKVTKIASEDLRRDILEDMMKKQHQEVEAKVKSKRDELKERDIPKDASSGGTSSTEMIWEGFEKYRGRDFRAALEIWEKAYELSPDSKTLETNIRMLKKKIESSR